jgi:hypothetical protein
MDETTRNARMWADLLTSDIAAKSAHFHVTDRAILYIEAGLPLAQVLDALKISRPTWYRRVREHEVKREENRATLAVSSVQDGGDGSS